MSKVMKVISVLSMKYNFSAEEGLKFYEEESVKKDKKSKKVKKVEVEDIFVEMSRVDNVVENVEKQEKVEKVEKPEKVKEKKVKVVKEKKEKKEEKEKKPRTEKQLAAFEKMKAKRADNLKAKKDLASVVSTPSDTPSDTVSDTVSDTEVEAVVEVEVVVDNERSEEDEVSVRKFSHEGKEYLISNENTLYDPETEEAVGRWNGSTIDAIGELEEEEIVE